MSFKGRYIVRKATKDEVYILRSILNHQLGINVADKVLPDKLLLRISPNTGRIREILDINGRRLATLRASSYTFNLTLELAKRIKTVVPSPRLRVIVINEISDDIIKHSSNVFSRHVLQVDEHLRAGDEALIVNEDDKLLCVGRLHLSPYEIIHFIRGVAVRVRECVSYD